MLGGKKSAGTVPSFAMVHKRLRTTAWLRDNQAEWMTSRDEVIDLLADNHLRRTILFTLDPAVGAYPSTEPGRAAVALPLDLHYQGVVSHVRAHDATGALLPVTSASAWEHLLSSAHGRTKPTLARSGGQPGTPSKSEILVVVGALEVSGAVIEVSFEERLDVALTYLSLPVGTAATLGATISAPPGLHFLGPYSDERIANAGHALMIQSSDHQPGGVLEVPLRYRVDPDRLGQDAWRLALMTYFVFAVPWSVVLLSRVASWSAGLFGYDLDYLRPSPDSAAAVLMGFPVVFTGLIVTRVSHPISQKYTEEARTFILSLAILAVIGAALLAAHFPPLPDPFGRFHVGIRGIGWTGLTVVSYTKLRRASSEQTTGWVLPPRPRGLWSRIFA